MPRFRVRYCTIEFGDTDIHVRTLKNRQQFNDEEGKAEKLGISSATWPLFGVIWDSSQVLANHMLEYDVEGKRILEVGCGIALTSLVLNHRHADITATDYHPEAESFLQQNVQLNNGQAIPFTRTAWENTDSDLGKFDLVIGSDFLYERNHAELLSCFINQHTKPKCEVIMVDPGRRYHARFSKLMVSLGYNHSQHQPKDTAYLDKPFKGQILNYTR